ncbi:MAG: hypothetical protein AAGA90_10520 [Actinomycetota bacterium]
MRSTTRTNRWFVLLFVFALFATACGGEVDDAADDNDDADTVSGADDSDDGGGEDDAAGDDDDAADDADDDATGDDEATGDDDDAADEPLPNFYDDPRGGIFVDFQEGFDRGDHPFTQINTFCTDTGDAADRVETDPGITADTISVTHIKSRLEDAVEIGFGIPVGDMNEMFRVFTEYINTECGGIRGRMLELDTIEVSLFGPTTQDERNAACLEATEDNNAVMILNSSGFQGSAVLCIVEEKETIFLSTQGQPDDFMERGQGRLISLSNTNSENLGFAAADLLATGMLEAGDVIGVVAPDTPGQPEDIEANLVVPLRDAGLEVVFDVITCGGSTVCAGGVPESVTNMRNAGIEHFFNAMGILTAPGYIDEMVRQGFEPGDVQFYASDFNSQASELVSGQIANEPTSGDLYNGAIVVDFRDTGGYRADDYAPTPYQEMCVGLYNDNNSIGANHQWEDQGGDSAYGMATSICTIMRAMARAIYDAGDNPTRAEIEDVLANLGPVDLSAMIPASITPDKGQMPDVIQTLDYSFPCTQPFPYVRGNGDAVCLTGRSDWRPAPR